MPVVITELVVRARAGAPEPAERESSDVERQGLRYVAVGR